MNDDLRATTEYLFGPAGTGSAADPISRANLALWAAYRSSLEERLRRQQVRVRLHAIDELLDLLEERHLAGQRELDRPLRQRVRQLAEVVGLPLPRKAVRARNTVRLHAALLDWQEDVLDEVAPERLELPDVREERFAAVAETVVEHEADVLELVGMAQDAGHGAHIPDRERMAVAS